jgi:plastocyanin
VSARATALAVAAALTLGACGEDRSALTRTETDPLPARPAQPGTPAQPEAPAATVTVLEREYRLAPAQIRVDRPATLEIGVRNRGRERHALAVVAPGGVKRTKTLAPRASTTLVVELDEPGRYRWYCPVDGHAGRGMRGSITVARAG